MRKLSTQTKGKCRDCRLVQKVSKKQWRFATKPKCVACGAILDKVFNGNLTIEDSLRRTPGRFLSNKLNNLFSNSGKS